MNLLSKTEKEDLKNGLKLRFVVLILFMLAVSFVVGFVMLLPPYFLAHEYLSKAVSIDYSLKQKDDGSDNQTLNIPTEINSKLKIFQEDSRNVSVADYFSKIVGYLPSGVRLNLMSFSKNEDYSGKKTTSILVSGTAADRESLISFSTLLKNSNLFSDVVVPVSSLTKDKNLPFSMNLFIKNE